MQLSNELLSQFAKATKDKSVKKTETIVYGTIVESNGVKYVQLDGSDILTPMASTTVIENGERVPVMIKNHMAIVTGNLSSPAIRTVDLDIAYSTINTELIAQAGLISSKVSQDDFNALNEIVQSNSSEIQQTPTNIKMEVKNQVGDAIDDLSIGARNLAAISRVTYHCSGGIANGATIDRDTAHYCRSGKVMVLYEYSGDYNLVNYGGIKLQSGKQYIISFWVASDKENQMLWVNMYNDGRGIDSNLGDIIYTGSGGSYHTRLFNCTVTDTYSLRLINFNGHVGRIMVFDVNVEEGNKATSWTPAPEDVDDKIAKSHDAVLEITSQSISSSVTSVNNRIDDVVNSTNAALDGKVNDSELANVVSRVEKAEEKITSDAIVSTVTSSTKYASDLANKANNSDITNVNNRIDNVVNDTTDALAGKASNEDLNKVISRVSTAEQKITSDAIVSTVRSSTLYANDLASKADETDITNVNNRIDGVVSDTNDALDKKVDSTYLVEKYSTTEQTDAKIKMEVGSKTVGATNLVRLSKVSFGNSSGTNTGALEDRSKVHYCRSGKIMRLYAFSGDYNVGQYDDITLAAGKQYTISFWAAAGADNQQLRVNIWNYERGVDINLGDIIYTGSNGGYYTRTFTCTATDSYALRFINFGGHTAQIMMMDVKLEEGNTATAWSPNPEEFRSGSSIEITEDKISLISEKTIVAVPDVDGETMVAQFDENGLTAERVIASNIAYRYSGPTVLNVNSNATSDQIASNVYYRSLTDVCNALSCKNLDKDVTVYIHSDTYGEAVLSGICGIGSITIHGNNHSLIGKMSCMRNTVDIAVNDLNVVATSDVTVHQGGPGWIQWNRCTFTGNNADNSYGLSLTKKASAFLHECGMYNATHLLNVGVCSDVVCNMIKGNGCTNFLYADGGNVKWYGTRPSGNIRIDHPSLCNPSDLSTLIVDAGVSQNTTNSNTVTYDFIGADSYVGGWHYFTDNDVRQGYTNGERVRGTIWFDVAAIQNGLSGKNIDRVSLRLFMQKGVGRGVTVSVQLYGTNTPYGDDSVAPNLITSYGTIGSTNPDELNEITIPTQVVTDIVNGTINALVLYSDDTEHYKDRSYSKNYARFDGSTSGDSSTRPRLTVNYS